MKKNNSSHQISRNKNQMLLRMFMAMILIFSFLVSGYKHSSTVHAAKNTFYASQMSGNKQGVKKMKVADGRLIIWGCLASAETADKAYENYFNEKGRYQKYTFKLSGKFRCFATGGDSAPVEYSLEMFKRDYVTQPDLGLGFLLKVRNGRLVALYTES